MTQPADGLTERTRRDVEAFLDDWRVEADVPGLSVAVVDDDALLYAAGLGARDIEEHAPATPETRYPFASTTKVLTGLTVLQLVERGDLALSDPIGDYVDTWTDVPGDPITVRELLTHATGIPADEGGPRNYLFGEHPPASPILTDDDRRRHLDGAAEWRVRDEDRFMYSDANYGLLGEIVAAVDGRPFARVVEEDVLAPLGMDGATIGFGELTALDDAVTGYTVEDGVPSATSLDLEADATGLGPAGAAGLLASVTAVGRLVRCLLNGGELDGTRVLAAELVAAMCSHQGPELSHVDGTPRGIGYGPRITELLDERLVEHAGTAPGVGRAYLGLLPGRDLGVALAVNTPALPVAALGQGVLALVAGEQPVEAVSSLGLREKVRSVTGTYESRHGTTVVRIDEAGGGASVEATNASGAGWSFPAIPETMAPDDYTFTAVWSAGLERSLDFRETDAGMELRLGAHVLRRTGRDR